MADNSKFITITNDFMFGYVMSKEDICKRFLEQILDVEIDHVDFLDAQKSLKEWIDSKSVRLDIHMRDGKTIYNCEMQTTNRNDLPKRMRYYQGQIDLSDLKPGISYKELSDSFIIFICTFDLFGKGQMVYTFQNRCEEVPGLVLLDGSTKVIVNIHGLKGNLSEDAKELLKYFADPSYVKQAKNQLVKDLDALVQEANMSEEWRRSYMSWEQAMLDAREDGYAEGKEKAFTMVSDLYSWLQKEGREEEIPKMLGDIRYFNKLSDEYRLKTE